MKIIKMFLTKSSRKVLICIVLMFFSSLAFATTEVTTNGAPSLTGSLFSSLDSDWRSPIKYMIIVTSLSFIPAAVIASTSFARIIIVLSMLRMALGLQSTPPNVVIVLLSLFLTFFSMSPVFDDVYTNAVTPYLDERQSLNESLEIGAGELKKFMFSHTDGDTFNMLLDSTGASLPADISNVSYMSLLPAFMLSEIKVAFQIGFILFIPFILIDLIVASILMGLGMIMVPPMTISMPIKILVFVLADGWALLSSSLISSIYQ